MQSDNKVVKVSLAEVPCVVLYERESGLDVTVMYVLVRTDYGETEEQAVARAKRIALKYSYDPIYRENLKGE